MIRVQICTLAHDPVWNSQGQDQKGACLSSHPILGGSLLLQPSRILFLDPCDRCA